MIIYFIGLLCIQNIHLISDGRVSWSRLGFKTKGTETLDIALVSLQILIFKKSRSWLFVYLLRSLGPGLVTKYWKSGKFVFY